MVSVSEVLLIVGVLDADGITVEVLN